MLHWDPGALQPSFPVLRRPDPPPAKDSASAVNLHEHFVQLPLLIRICAHLADPFLADLCSKQRPKSVPPKSNRLLADAEVLPCVDGSCLARFFRRRDHRGLRSCVRPVCAALMAAGPPSRAIAMQCPAGQWIKSACQVPIKLPDYICPGNTTGCSGCGLL
jgi:hypothetical protein